MRNMYEFLCKKIVKKAPRSSRQREFRGSDSGNIRFALALQMALGAGEAAAPDFRNLADDHKTLRIDGSGQMLDFWQFMVGHDAEDHFRILAQEAALAVEDGHAPVNPG